MNHKLSKTIYFVLLKWHKKLFAKQSLLIPNDSYKLVKDTNKAVIRKINASLITLTCCLFTVYEAQARTMTEEPQARITTEEAQARTMTEEPQALTITDEPLARTTTEEAQADIISEKSAEEKKPGLYIKYPDASTHCNNNYILKNVDRFADDQALRPSQSFMYHARYIETIISRLNNWFANYPHNILVCSLPENLEAAIPFNKFCDIADYLNEPALDLESMIKIMYMWKNNQNLSEVGILGKNLKGTILIKGDPHNNEHITFLKIIKQSMYPMVETLSFGTHGVAKPSFDCFSEDSHYLFISETKTLKYHMLDNPDGDLDSRSTVMTPWQLNKYLGFSLHLNIKETTNKITPDVYFTIECPNTNKEIILDTKLSPKNTKIYDDYAYSDSMSELMDQYTVISRDLYISLVEHPFKEWLWQTNSYVLDLVPAKHGATYFTSNSNLVDAKKTLGIENNNYVIRAISQYTLKDVVDEVVNYISNSHSENFVFLRFPVQTPHVPIVTHADFPEAIKNLVDKEKKHLWTMTKISENQVIIGLSKGISVEHTDTSNQHWYPINKGVSSSENWSPFKESSMFIMSEQFHAFGYKLFRFSDKYKINLELLPYTIRKAIYCDLYDRYIILSEAMADNKRANTINLDTIEKESTGEETAELVIKKLIQTGELTPISWYEARGSVTWLPFGILQYVSQEDFNHLLRRHRKWPEFIFNIMNEEQSLHDFYQKILFNKSENE